MALLKSHYIDHFDTTFTGAYHKITEVTLEAKAEPVASGEQDNDPDNNAMRINYNYNTFPHSGARWLSAASVDGGSEDLPSELLVNVSGYDSLIRECYNHLKTGALSGAIDV